MDITTNADRYKEQLLTKEQLETAKPEELLGRLSEERRLTTGYEGYSVHFDTQEEFLEGQQVMASDDALVEYYEKHDPQMLKGLKSKWSTNVVGIKAEKKKLRQKFAASRSEKEVEQAEAQKLQQKAWKEAKEDGSWGQGARPYREVQDAVDDMKKKDTDAIVDYFKATGKTPDELSKIREKVAGLGYLRRQQLKRIVAKSMPVDADLNGIDNELVKEAQDRYAKTHSPDSTWETYRIVRDVQKFQKTHDVPDDTEEKVRKYNEAHKKSKEERLQGKEKQIKSGDIERVARAFMKEVNYEIKDGKKVPATQQDAENLQFNEKFVDSFLSDNEEDWSFRFEEIERSIESSWEFYSPLAMDLIAGKVDYATAKVDPVQYYMYNQRMLRVSGLNNEKSSFFKSAYCKGLGEKRKKELEAKYNVVQACVKYMELKFAEQGMDVNNFDFVNKDTLNQVRADAYKDAYMDFLKSQYEANKGLL